MKETDISRAIVKMLSSLGHLVVRVQSGKVQTSSGSWMQMAEKGCPDLICLSSGGVTTWLEVKTPIGSLNADQKAWHERAKRNGHRVAVVRSPAEALAAVMA